MIVNDMRVEVRLMKERDKEPLMRGLSLSRHHIENRWAERLEGRRTMFVADVEGRLAGSVSFEQRDELPGLMHLFALAVLPELQGRGIGTRLVAAVEDEALARGLRGVHLGVAIDNDGALRLYRRLGYERVGEAYDARWTWFSPNGEQREVVERCYRMLKPVPNPAADAASVALRDA